MVGGFGDPQKPRSLGESPHPTRRGESTDFRLGTLAVVLITRIRSPLKPPDAASRMPRRPVSKDAMIALPRMSRTSVWQLLRLAMEKLTISEPGAWLATSVLPDVQTPGHGDGSRGRGAATATPRLGWVGTEVRASSGRREHGWVRLEIDPRKTWSLGIDDGNRPGRRIDTRGRARLDANLAGTSVQAGTTGPASNARLIPPNPSRRHAPDIGAPGTVLASAERRARLHPVPAIGDFSTGRETRQRDIVEWMNLLNRSNRAGER